MDCVGRCGCGSGATQAHRRTGNHKIAAQHYKSALVHDPRRPDLLLQLGMTQQFNLRHLRHAATTYRAAPSHPASIHIHP